MVRYLTNVKISLHLCENYGKIIHVSYSSAVMVQMFLARTVISRLRNQLFVIQ